MRSQLSLVGVGYQGTDVTGFVRGLRSDAVTTVVDVRLTPISRKRGLSKTLLAAHLAGAGIGYEHLRALGNPKWNRPGFAGTDEELRTARATFAAMLDTDEANQALDRIEALSSAGRVALMCFEADGHRCHRTVVLDALAGRAALVAN